MFDDFDDSNVFFPAVNSPPRIIKQPPTDEMLFQVAQQGENDKPFIIECEAEGEPQPK
jgi:neuronal cell adhesion molecule